MSLSGKSGQVLLPDDSVEPSVSDVGGKALGLYRLQKIGCQLPPWFVLTAGDEEDSLLAKTQSALEKLDLKDSQLAVRSSARAEDGGLHSFAGQFSTILHVRAEDLMEAIQAVRDSADSTHCRAYARQNGIDQADLVPAVVVQKMISPDVSGVLFTADPVSGNEDVCVIAALYGVGEGIVSGECTPDTYTVDKSGVILNREIADKRFQITQDGKVDVPEKLRKEQVCPDDVIKELAGLASRIAKALGGPQDIEWCRKGGEIYILQSRPITTLPETRKLEEATRLWDNTNLVEGYPGITLPLTFSFIESMYAGVYRGMLADVGLSDEILDQHRSRFRMLGYYHGRVYYNLLNWYRLLTLIPGSERHRQYFNEMLGIGGSLNSADLMQSQSVRRYYPVRIVIRLTWGFLRLQPRIEKFLKTVREVREQASKVDLDTLGLTELVQRYYDCEHLLLKRWTTPQFNDFYCQTATGLLKSCIVKWLGEDQVTGMDELLPADETVESEKAVASLCHLASAIRNKPELVEVCKKQSGQPLLDVLRADREIKSLFDEHVRKYGDRWQADLKLEVITPAEDSKVLAEVLAIHVLAPEEKRTATPSSPFQEAVAILPSSKRLIINLLAKLSRRLIANRENTRFERTRAFGMVRRIFRVIGRKLHQRGHLQSAEDVFYLSKDEIFGFIEGTNPSAQTFKSIVQQRAQAFQQWSEENVPGRFTTNGLLSEYEPTEPGHHASGGRVLKGTAASPGIVRAKVRVIHSPAELQDARGCIIAAEATDPGWSFIFPLVSGVLVERGSLLSHAAIIAREMQIPAIVGIEGLMSKLPDGALIELNGSTGVVTVMEN